MELQSTTSTPIVVIGAGIIGAHIALALRKQGQPVILLDKGSPGMGCSYGNNGAISPDQCIPAALPGLLRRVPRWIANQHGPLVIRWNRALPVMPWLWRWVMAARPAQVERSAAALKALHAPSLEKYAQILGAAAHGLIEKTGQLHVWTGNAASPTEAYARALREKHEIRSEVLSAARIREIDPELAPGFDNGVYFPDNGHTVNPLRLVQTIVDLFVQAGGHVAQGQVRGFERDGDKVRNVLLDNGRRMPVRGAVIAAGIDSLALTRPLGDHVPLEAERGYHIMLPDPRVRPTIKISNRNLMFGLTPMEHGVRVAGTVEFAKPGTPMNEPRVQALLENARRMYPRLNTEGAQSWMGSRPSIPDSLPVIDYASGARNLVYAFGHGHYGLSGAPVTAELVCHLLAGAPAPIDPAPYRLNRFA
jgi:D-amino-acid dehydrogenase